MRTCAFRHSMAVLAALSWLGISSTLSAQVFGAADTTVPGAVDETATVTLDVKDRPLADVLKVIRDRSGANILLAPMVEARVTIAFSGVPWREALGLVAENAGCVVVETRGRVFKVEKPPRVTFSFQDEDIRRVIQAIAKAAEADLVIAPDVKGLVTMEIKDKPWRDALDNVVKTLGYHVVEEERGVLRVVTSAALTEQLESRVIELKYLRPRAPYIATIKTDFAVKTDFAAAKGGTSAAPAGGGNNQSGMSALRPSDFPLLFALKKLLSKNGDLDYFDKQNAIFVKDTKPVLDHIVEIVEKLDVEPAQIFIDVKFVTTTDTDNLDLAMGAEEVTATFNGAAIPSKVPFNLGEGGFDDDIFPGTDALGNHGPFDDSAFIDDQTLKTGLLDFRSVRLAVRLNQIQNHVEVVQAPRIITLDHQEATVFVGDIIRYAETEASTNQAGGLAFAVKEAENSPVETGFQLLIIPHVIPNTNKIAMTVIPQARFLSGTTDPDLEGFNLFGTEPATISLPQVTSQTVVTNMMLESGQTGEIGGLITDRKSKLVNKVPWLGDLPFIGFFFRRTQDGESHNHLLVFLTPTIIRGMAQSAQDLQQKLDADAAAAEAQWQKLQQENAGNGTGAQEHAGG